MHNHGIHCQSLESISCLFTNLLVIWYKDKVQNKLSFNKTSGVCLSLRLHSFHTEQKDKNKSFSLLYNCSQVFAATRMDVYHRQGCSLDAFVFPFNINTLACGQRSLFLSPLCGSRENRSPLWWCLCLPHLPSEPDPSPPHVASTTQSWPRRAEVGAQIPAPGPRPKPTVPHRGPPGGRTHGSIPPHLWGNRTEESEKWDKS